MATDFVPALRFHRLTPYYDALSRTFTREQEIKTRLVEQAALEPGMRVLDLGCGTATLSILLARAAENVQVVGLDMDPNILAIARSKIGDQGVELCQGSALDPPLDPRLAPGSFDRVVSCLVFHHLGSDGQHRALESAFDRLRPGGELHLADWGRPQDLWMSAASISIRLLDGFETTADSFAGRLPEKMRQAGFVDVVETQRLRTLFGTLALYRARRP